jgi:2-polyprenyl-3-methyl-5-hydroxy-6-metoxy-1,4-benzoquinol methylase
MSEEQQASNLKNFTQETQTLWDGKAEFWDELMGDEGNLFQRLLVGPTTERLLEVQPGMVILDVACGNGVFARRLAQLGAQIVAADYSARLVELAKARSEKRGDQIEFQQVDATNSEQLLALGEKRFDAVVCNMALQDMTTIEPLINTVPRLLKPGGRFVFAIPHPCFNQTTARKIIEEEDRDGQLVTSYALKIYSYLTTTVQKAMGAPNEPNPHYYFDRPLNVLLNTCFKAGFVMDGLEEPKFESGEQPGRPFHWANYPEIPPVLAVRMRLL